MNSFPDERTFVTGALSLSDAKVAGIIEKGYNYAISDGNGTTQDESKTKPRKLKPGW